MSSQIQKPCPTCAGTGQRKFMIRNTRCSTRCEDCDGTGHTLSNPVKTIYPFGKN